MEDDQEKLKDKARKGHSVVYDDGTNTFFWYVYCSRLSSGMHWDGISQTLSGANMIIIVTVCTSLVCHLYF